MGRTPLLVCGTQMMLWDEFEERGLAILSAKAQELRRSEIEEWNEKVALPSRLRRSTTRVPTSTTLPESSVQLGHHGPRLRESRGLMLSIFRLAQTRNCTDQRDRVFGFHGILKDRGIFLRKPDYSRHHSDVHEEFIWAFLEHTHSLKILYGMSEPGFLTRKTGPRTHWLHTIGHNRRLDGHLSPEGLPLIPTIPISINLQIPILDNHDPVILGHVLGTIDTVDEDSVSNLENKLDAKKTN